MGLTLSAVSDGRHFKQALLTAIISRHWWLSALNCHRYCKIFNILYIINFVDLFCHRVACIQRIVDKRWESGMAVVQKSIC